MLSLLLTGPAAGPDVEVVRETSALLLVLTLLLAVFITGVALTMVLRRRRRLRAAAGKTTPAPERDPWEEAGQRAQPFERDGD